MGITRTAGLIVIGVLLAGLSLTACQGDNGGPLDTGGDSSDDTLFDGTLYFSGRWAGVTGTYSLNLKTLDAFYITDLVGKLMKTAGTADAILLTDVLEQMWLMNAVTGDAVLLGAIPSMSLAPNGRKYFYTDPYSGALYEGHVGATGGRLFAADGRFGSHSPSMQRAAYLTAAGLVITDSDNLAPIAANLTSYVKPNESIVLPATGNYFPQWSHDESRVAAALTLQDNDSGYQWRVGFVFDLEGKVKFFLANNPSDPLWSASDRYLVYVSNNSLFYWDFVTEENVLIFGGATTVSSHARLNDEGNYLAFVRTEADGRTGGQVWDAEQDLMLTAVPAAANEAFSLEWLRRAYCAEGENTAPAIVDLEVLVNGVPEAEPVIDAGDVGAFRLSLDDAECNLARGVLLYTTGDSLFLPWSLNLPDDAGCDDQVYEYPAPALLPGEYAFAFVAEDVCGAAGDAATVTVTYTDDDDDDDNDDDDNDNNDDNDNDNNDDDTSPVEDGAE
jgi:hypothetical protein